MSIDTLIKHADLFSMQGEGVGYIDDGAIAINNGIIVEVGKTSALLEKFQPKEVINAENKMVLPGFVDAHLHSYWGALRGVAQDTKNWMHKGVGPFRKYLNKDARIAGSRMNILEGLASGTTTFGDYSSPIHEIAHFYAKLGARAQLTCHIREVPDDISHLNDGDLYPFDQKVGEDTLNESLHLINNWNGAENGRISTLLGPQGPDFLSENLLKEVKKISRKENIKIHMHVAQSTRESEQINNRYGKRSIDFLEEHGLLNENLIAAHLTDANEEEVKKVAESGASMILCSGSIGIIAGRIPPAYSFLTSGGIVGLGSDQCSGNNCNQIINEMKLTALFNKIRFQNPEVLPAWKVLRMATIEGAKALGLEKKVGSIEEGKKADIIFVDLNEKTMQPVIKHPMRNHVPNLVYSARGHEIQRVMVDGKTLYKDKEYLTVDEDEIMFESQKAAAKLAESIDVNDFSITKAASQMQLNQL